MLAVEIAVPMRVHAAESIREPVDDTVDPTASHEYEIDGRVVVWKAARQ